jgi:hypothetical protein
MLNISDKAFCGLSHNGLRQVDRQDNHLHPRPFSSKAVPSPYHPMAGYHTHQVS